MKIGFIGLGHMGLPMAINLVKSGHEVTGFDLQSAPLAAIKDAGGNIATSLENLARNQEVIITMLQTGEQVKQVLLGHQGLFAISEECALFIDCSSIDVASSREIHEWGKRHRLQVVDAPVSGGVSGAHAATLTFMLGGDESSFLRAKPILAHMGKKIIHTGAAGSGQAAKLCNNMILGVSMIAISEAFILADRLGLSPKKMHEVAMNSSGQCWAMSNYVPVADVLDNVPANRHYEPGFTAAMMLKDLKLSQDAAVSTGTKTPLGHHAKTLFDEWVNDGHGELDFSSIIKLIDD